MHDWIGQLLDGNDDAAGAALDAHLTALRAADRRDARPAVANAEARVRANPAGCFAFDADGYATLDLGEGQPLGAGRFETPTLAELATRIAAREPGTRDGGRVRLLVLDGMSPATDVGALQAFAPPDALFQVASQFNALESPGPYLADVAHYFGDPTQGPRASISAYPATLLRRYAAPAAADGTRFVQQNIRQVELLADALGAGAAPDGYFTGAHVADVDAAVEALESRFDRIRVGLHDRAQVVLGHDWHGPVDGERHVAQVFTSTVAGGGYGGERALGPDRFGRACRQLLRAAYLGTLRAAQALGQRRAVLTLIGGGVFGNDPRAILDAIAWAFDRVRDEATGGLDVVLNGYNLGTLFRDAAVIERFALDRDGAFARVDGFGLLEVSR